MNVAIIGASGFVGKNLIKYLLLNTNHKIFAISHNIKNIIIDDKYSDRVIKIEADVLDEIGIKEALKGTDIVYYLVHLMAMDNVDFYEAEIRAAKYTCQASNANGVKRIIYLSGLGNDSDNLSKHLSSRHKTGDIFRESNIEVIELRASMIIGEGSISFEIIKNIVNKAPIILLPKWTKTLTEPIGINDVLLYLKHSIEIKIDNSVIIEIGGPEIISYENFIRKYVKLSQKSVFIIRISFLSGKIAGKFLALFTPKKLHRVGQCMIDSFRNEMIVTNDMAQKIFPDIHPAKIEEILI